MRDELVGVRFLPTDEEIISHYLKNKMNGQPDTNIKEVDILRYEPSELPREARWKSDPWWYFLWGMEYKYRNSKRVDRTTRTGYWKLTGKERQIKDQQNEMIGYKRSLVFCRRGGGSTATRRGANTNWIMTEYHSTMAHNNPKEYVVCCLTKKGLRKKRNSKIDAVSTSNTQSQHSAANNPSENIFAMEDFELSPEPGSEFFDGWDDNFPLGWMDLVQESLLSKDENETNNYKSPPLASPDECYSHKTIRTHPRHFSAPMSLKGVCVKDSNDSYNEIINLVTTAKSPLSRSFIDSKDDQPMKSMGLVYVIDHKALTNHCELIQDGSSINLRSYEAENPPKSVNFTEWESAPNRLQLLETVTRDKEKEAEKIGTAGSAGMENSIVKIEEGEKMTRKATEKTGSKLKSDMPDGSTGKGCFIIQVTPPLIKEPSSPIVNMGNFFLGVILLVVIVWDMATLK